MKPPRTSRATDLRNARSARADVPRDGFSKRYNRAARQKRLTLYAIVAMLAQDDDAAIAMVRHQRISAWARSAAEKRSSSQERKDP